MRVIILGCKKIGMAIRQFLENEKGINSIICIDKKIKGMNTNKVTFKKVNLEFITGTDLKGGHVLINTVKDMEKERLAKLCKSARINLIDVTIPGASSIPPTAKEISPKRKNWMIFGAGVSPGLSNIMVNLAYQKMKENNAFENIEIMNIQSRFEQKYVFPFGAEEAIDYALIPPIKSIKGKIQKIDAYHRVKMKVPNEQEALGTFTFRDYYGSEIESLSSTMKEIDLTYKFGGADADYLDAIRTMYRSLKSINGEEEARKKVRKFFMPQDPDKPEKAEGVSGIYIKIGEKIKGFGLPHIKDANKYEYLNYATYPMAAFVNAILKQTKDILPRAYMPEQLDLNIQNNIINDMKKQFVDNNW